MTSVPSNEGQERGERGGDGIESTLTLPPEAFIALVRDDPPDALRKQGTCAAGDVAGHGDPCNVVRRAWQQRAAVVVVGEEPRHLLLGSLLVAV